MEEVGIFYGHLVYSTTIWYLLWPLVTFYGQLVYFPQLHEGKSGNPGSGDFD
jgi:hypothetical protein